MTQSADPASSAVSGSSPRATDLAPARDLADGAGSASWSWRRASDLPRAWLGAEFVLLLLIGPLFYFYLVRGPGLLFPALWALFAFTLSLLLLDPTFDRRTLWNARGMARELGRLLVVFLVLGGLLTLAVAVYDRVVEGPSIFLGLPRSRPTLWIMIMVFYPLVSVYPQEVIWRAFIFHRYARIFPGRFPMILASAIAFGHAHIVFHNWLAVGLCVIGGLLFARTFDRSRSTLAAWIDHALYGCLVFTIGLGSYFYSGNVHVPT